MLERGPVATMKTGSSSYITGLMQRLRPTGPIRVADSNKTKV